MNVGGLISYINPPKLIVFICIFVLLNICIGRVASPGNVHAFTAVVIDDFVGVIC